MESACIVLAFLVRVTLLANIAEGKTWAVLVAGSNTCIITHIRYSSLTLYRSKSTVIIQLTF
jgi:hypothetical protein